MKYIILLIVSSLFISPKNDFITFIDTNYIGGKIKFLTNFYNSINYPKQARENCGIGKLKTRLVLNEEGRIERIDFLNNLGYEIDKEVRRVLELTDGNWIKSESKREIEFIIAFQIGDNQEIKGDMRVIASIIGSIDYCKTNEELYNETLKKVKKKKYKKAMKLCDELLKREPDSTEYKELSDDIKLKIKK